jgi:hypothetical protein
MDLVLDTTSTSTKPRRKPYLLILQSGLLSIIVTLGVVYWLNRNTDYNMMGWYYFYIIPVGAIVVGAAAGSGFAIAAWLTGLRVTRIFLVIVILLQASAYVGAEYLQFLEFRSMMKKAGLVMADTAQPPTFLQYIDMTIRSSKLETNTISHDDGPLESVGYLYTLSAFLGFVVSGVIAPACMRGSAYCAKCQQYRSRRELGIIPMTIPSEPVSDDPDAESDFDARHEAAMEIGQAQYERIRDLAMAGDSSGFNAEVSLLKAQNRSAGKLPLRLVIDMDFCSGCGDGLLGGTVIAVRGDSMDLDRLPTLAVPSTIVDGLRLLK